MAFGFSFPHTAVVKRSNFTVADGTETQSEPQVVFPAAGRSG